MMTRLRASSRAADRVAAALVASRLWILAVAVTIMTWPLATVSPFSVGLDPSWAAMLHFAAYHHMNFGDELSYTYGPLGFLAVPKVFYGLTGAFAFIFAFLVHIVLCYVLLAAARRSFGWLIAVLVTTVVAGLTVDTSDALSIIVFVLAIATIDGHLAVKGHRWCVPLAGFLAAGLLMMKFNVGMLAIIAFPLAAWFLSPLRWRSVALFCSSFGMSLVGLWFATGGNPLDIPRWLRDSYELSAGYSDGALFTDPARAWELSAFTGLAVFGGALLMHRLRDWNKRASVAAVLVTLAFAFSWFKHGFVRHDVYHSPTTFLIVGTLPLAFRWVGRQRVAALAMVTGAFWVTFLALGMGPRDVFLPVTADAERFIDQTRVVADPARRRREIDTAKELMAARVALDRETLDLVRNQTVHVEPYETSVVWLYELAWRPAPIFQTYAAHTAALDSVNARALGAADGPARILRFREAVRLNNRLPEGESPAYTLAMICNYRQIRATDAWQVLERTENRCGPERRVASFDARNGQVIALPRAGGSRTVVYIRMAVSRPFRERLRSFLYKPKLSPWVVLDEDPARVFTVFFRTAANPLILRGPARTGWSPLFSGESARADRVRFEGFDAPFRVEVFERAVAPT